MAGNRKRLAEMNPGAGMNRKTKKKPGSKAKICWIHALALFLCLLIALPLCGQRPTYQPAQFSIAGVVVNARNGDPVRSARLTLERTADEGFVAETEADESGHFILPNLPSGKYRLTASRSGFATQTFEQHENFSSAIVTGPEEQTSNLLFRMAPAAELYGTVRGEDGDPVNGATVKLYRLNTERASFEKLLNVAEEVSDDQGSYLFANLPPGEYRVVVLAHPWFALHPAHPRPGFNHALDVAYPITFFDNAQDEATATPLRLEAGSREQANVTLQAAPALRLSVSRAQGENQPSLLPMLFGHTVEADGTETTTESSGETTFIGIPPGHYQLTAGDPQRLAELDVASSAVADPRQGQTTANLTGSLEVAPGKPYGELAMVHLEPAETGSGAHPINLSVRNGSFNTDSTPAGLWTLTVRNGYGYEVPVLSLTQNGRTRTGNRLQLREGATNVVVAVNPGRFRLKGLVRQAGKPLAGAMIMLIPADLRQIPALIRRDQSDSDGSFELGSILPGKYTVVALTGAWQLDWTRAEELIRYLPAGKSVFISESSDETIALSGGLEAQPANPKVDRNAESR